MGHGQEGGGLRSAVCPQTTTVFRTRTTCRLIMAAERSLASGEKERLEQQWKKLKNLLMQLRKALGTLV